MITTIKNESIKLYGDVSLKEMITPSEKLSKLVNEYNSVGGAHVPSNDSDKFIKKQIECERLAVLIRNEIKEENKNIRTEIYKNSLKELYPVAALVVQDKIPQLFCVFKEVGNNYIAKLNTNKKVLIDVLEFLEYERKNRPAEGWIIDKNGKKAILPKVGILNYMDALGAYLTSKIKKDTEASELFNENKKEEYSKLNFRYLTSKSKARSNATIEKILQQIVEDLIGEGINDIKPIKVKMKDVNFLESTLFKASTKNHAQILTPPRKRIVKGVTSVVWRILNDVEYSIKKDTDEKNI